MGGFKDIFIGQKVVFGAGKIRIRHNKGGIKRKAYKSKDGLNQGFNQSF